MHSYYRFKHAWGFTLIELMIVVAIVGILAAMAVPNFMVYARKSRVAAVLATSEIIRTALASYAVDSQGNFYPSVIADYNALHTLVNKHGGELGPDESFLGMTFRQYTPVDVQGDTLFDSYTMSLRVNGVPAGISGHIVEVNPTGTVRR